MTVTLAVSLGFCEQTAALRSVCRHTRDTVDSLCTKATLRLNSRTAPIVERQAHGKLRAVIDEDALLHLLDRLEGVTSVALNASLSSPDGRLLRSRFLDVLSREALARAAVSALGPRAAEGDITISACGEIKLDARSVVELAEEERSYRREQYWDDGFGGSDTDESVDDDGLDEIYGPYTSISGLDVRPARFKDVESAMGLHMLADSVDDIVLRLIDSDGGREEEAAAESIEVELEARRPHFHCLN